jgi:putative FmdB family regulatory protein
MPYYEYECQKCHKQFAVQRSLDEHDKHPKEECPKCGSKKVERVFTEVYAHAPRK